MSMDRNLAAAPPRSEGEIQALKHLGPAEVKEAERLALTIDVRDSLSITTYGLRPQKEMSALADPILKLVSTKDAGVAGKVARPAGCAPESGRSGPRPSPPCGGFEFTRPFPLS